jgi:hypothetical protein
MLRISWAIRLGESESMSISVSRTEVLLRLAMPLAIVLAALIIYRGMTKPFDECVTGSKFLSHDISAALGSTREGWDEATAQTECGKHH